MNKKKPTLMDGLRKKKAEQKTQSDQKIPSKIPSSKPTPQLSSPPHQQLLPAPKSSQRLLPAAPQKSLPAPSNRPIPSKPKPSFASQSRSSPSGQRRSETWVSSPGIHHAEQRVGVFLDVQNMYYSGRQLYNQKVNFANILKEAVKGRKLVRAISYVIKADVGEEQNFFDALQNIGYEVKQKDLQVFAGGAKKGDWDIGIAMDTIELAPKLDTIVLVSGDGDFIPLVQHLQKAMGCRVEVLAFGKTASGKLREEVDIFVDLESDKERFLISR